MNASISKSVLALVADSKNLCAAEVAALEAIDAAALAALWCDLNDLGSAGNPPLLLTDYFPANWKTLTHHAVHDFIWPYMAWIQIKIGFDACRAEWRRTRCA